MVRKQRLTVVVLFLYLLCAWACGARQAPDAPRPPGSSALTEVSPEG